MSWTKPRRKHVERGTEKEYLLNDQKSVDKTAVEMLNREGGWRLKKKRENNDNIKKISGLCRRYGDTT